ncbi:MAG: hypothetical protein JKY27_14070 [Magnetovibrio sp.]|nr:hypothetical protein [Magnetovibrio sp.]
MVKIFAIAAIALAVSPAQADDGRVVGIAIQKAAAVSPSNVFVPGHDIKAWTNLTFAKLGDHKRQKMLNNIMRARASRGWVVLETNAERYARMLHNVRVQRGWYSTPQKIKRAAYWDMVMRIAAKGPHGIDE